VYLVLSFAEPFEILGALAYVIPSVSGYPYGP